MYVQFLIWIGIWFSLFLCVYVWVWEYEFLEHNICSGEFTCCSNSIDLLSKLFLLFWWCNISPDIIAKLLGISLLLVFTSNFFQRFTVSSPLLAHTMDLSYLLAWFRFIRIKLRLAHIECLEYCNVSNEIDFVV